MKKILNDSFQLISSYNNDLDIDNYNYVCCIGFFDLIHLGHQKIINKTLEISKSKKLKSICFTFDIKPRDFINNSHFNIWDEKTRIEALKTYNFDYIFKILVSPSFLKIKPNEFVHALINKFNIKHIVVGDNFHFGFNASGDTDTLIKNFSSDGVSVIKTDNISTTEIKRLISLGDIISINKFLNKNLMLKAKLQITLYSLDIGSNKIKDGLYNVIVLNNKYIINIINNSFEINLKEKIPEIELFFY